MRQTVSFELQSQDRDAVGVRERLKGSSPEGSGGISGSFVLLQTAGGICQRKYSPKHLKEQFLGLSCAGLIHPCFPFLKDESSRESPVVSGQGSALPLLEPGFNP